MATKIFCDGCDKELKSPLDKKWNVQVANATTSKLSETFDLCDSCGLRLEANTNPKQWARAIAENTEPRMKRSA